MQAILHFHGGPFASRFSSCAIFMLHGSTVRGVPIFAFFVSNNAYLQKVLLTLCAHCSPGLQIGFAYHCWLTLHLRIRERRLAWHV